MLTITSVLAVSLSTLHFPQPASPPDSLQSNYVEMLADVDCEKTEREGEGEREDCEKNERDNP